MDLLRVVYNHDLDFISNLVADHKIDLDENQFDSLNMLSIAILDPELDIQFIKGLLKLGANPNVQDDDRGWRPLHFAAQDNKHEVISLLIDSGADPNLTSNLNETPILLAVFNKMNDMTSINLLLDNGADFNIENSHGVSALSLSKSIEDRETLNLFESHQ